MLPKKQRLSRQEFSSVYKNGKRVQNDFCTIIAKKADNKPQFSVVISKKVSKSSVERHLLKRRVYSIVRSFLKEYPLFLYSVIFILHPHSKKISFESLHKSLVQTLASLV